MNAVSGSDQLKTSVEWRNTCKTVIIPEVSNKLFLLESNAATHFKFIIVCLPYDGFCMNSKQQLLTPSSTLPTNFSQLQSHKVIKTTHSRIIALHKTFGNEM